MNTHGLRIGNYVMYGRFVCTVYHIFFGDVVDAQSEEKGYLTKVSVEPIPLTEEILLKCGFDNLKGTKYYHNKNDRLYCDISHILIKHFGNFNGILVETQYLHQLQNIYFDLTGEELVVKL